MSWIILCGLDRTGKSSVAETLKKDGYEIVHFSAPDKKFYKPGYTGPSYFDEVVEQLISLSGRKVVFDRFIYGELVWPYVYKRVSLLNEEEIDMIREIEEQNDVQRYVMHDPDTEAHWKRCVDNNEKLTPSQFKSARDLFLGLAEKYGFIVTSMQELTDAFASGSTPEKKARSTDDRVSVPQDQTRESILGPEGSSLKTKNIATEIQMTPEQRTLMEANAINEILSNRVIKKKGEFFDALEGKVREFLNQELAVLLGLKKTEVPPTQSTKQLSDEEVQFIRMLLRNANSKRTNK